jgi:5-methylcytosine-specific restriction endonuclease McrA
MPMKPCLDCGRLFRFERGGRSRCDECTTEHERRRGSSVARGYDHEYRKVRAEVLERDGWMCHWCGEPANTVDHVVPLAQGGARLDEDNLVAACRSCNSGRAAAARRNNNYREAEDDELHL